MNVFIHKKNYFLWATRSLNDLIIKIFIGLWKMKEVVAFLSY